MVTGHEHLVSARDHMVTEAIKNFVTNLKSKNLFTIQTTLDAKFFGIQF
jgi:hypothetical protein